MNIDWEKLEEEHKNRKYNINKKSQITKNGIPFENMEEIVEEMNKNDKKIHPDIKEDRHYIFMGENGFAQIGINGEGIPIGYWDIYMNEQEDKIKELQKRD